MRLKLTILAAMAAFSMMGQEAAKMPAPKPTESVAQVAPTINSAKLWRLVARSQALHQQLNESEQGKAVKAADDELQAEQAKLNSQCGAGWQLGVDQVASSPSYQDLICVKAPVEQAKKEK